MSLSPEQVVAALRYIYPGREDFVVTNLEPGYRIDMPPDLAEPDTAALEVSALPGMQAEKTEDIRFEARSRIADTIDADEYMPLLMEAVDILHDMITGADTETQRERVAQIKALKTGIVDPVYAARDAAIASIATMDLDTVTAFDAREDW